MTSSREHTQTEPIPEVRGAGEEEAVPEAPSPAESPDEGAASDASDEGAAASGADVPDEGAAASGAEAPNKGLLGRTRLLDVSTLRDRAERDKVTERLDSSELAQSGDDAPPAIAPAGPGRRRRARRAVAVLAAVLVVAVVLVGAGALLAERWIGDKVDSAVRSAMPGLAADARITTRGYLLPQVLSGTLDVLDVTSSGLHLGGLNITAPPDDGAPGDGSPPVTDLNLTNVRASLRGIALEEPYTASRVEVTADLPWGQVSQVVTALVPDLEGIEVSPQTSGAGARPGTMTATAGTGVGQAVLSLTPSVSRDGGLTFTITQVRIGLLTFGMDDGSMSRTALSYMGLDSNVLEVEPQSLPTGLRATSVSVTQGGLRLVLGGRDVPLSGL